MSKFMAVSRQAINLDKEKIRLETKVLAMERELSRRAGERLKLVDKVKQLESEVKELKNLAEELRTDIVNKESCLDHLQKKSDALSSSLGKAKDKAIKELKASDAYTKLLDKNYVARIEDFRQDACEAFLGVDFDSIRLRVATESSLISSTSEDIDIDDDATTFDGPKNNAPTDLSQQFLTFITSNISSSSFFFFWGSVVLDHF